MSRNPQTPRWGALSWPSLVYFHSVNGETAAEPAGKGVNHRRRFTGVCGRASRYYVHLASRYGQFCTPFLNVHSVVWLVCSFNSLSVFPFCAKAPEVSAPASLWIWFLPSARAPVFLTDSGDHKRINEFVKFLCLLAESLRQSFGRVTIACCFPPLSEFRTLSHLPVPPNWTPHPPPPPSKL